MAASETPHPTFFSGHEPRPRLREASLVAMWLVLAALTMLFAAGMLAYLLIRFRDASPDAGTIVMPLLLWVSTVFLIANSVVIEMALRMVQRQRIERFQRMLVLSVGLVLAFVFTQAIGLKQVLDQHWLMLDEGMALYGMVFMMVFLHALHIVGGLIPFGVILVKAFRNHYDHEHALPVRLLAMYWHYLDVVWLVMFALLLIAG